MAIKKTRTALVLAVLTAFALLGTWGSRTAAEAEEGEDLVTNLRNHLSNFDFSRMYVGVDKPLYRPGETVWFRCWEVSLRTFTSNYDHQVVFQLIDPRGAVAMEKVVWTQSGLAANDLELPLGMVGGEYRLRATSDRGVMTERAIVVSVYEAPRVKKTLEFVRKAYGPGDRVGATLELERATGEALGNTPFTATVKLDSQEIQRLSLQTNRDGKALISFDLPATIALGDGLLTVLVDEGGVTESIQRRIPITLDRIDLAIFPEGGDLVEGLPSRVYFSAASLIGKPVDVDANVVDDQGTVVAELSSFHAGMGRFELTPEKGRRYELVVTKPTSVKQKLAVPAAKESGCVMQTVDDFESKEDAVSVKLRCSEKTKLVATLVLRGTLLTHAVAEVGQKPVTVALKLPDDGSVALQGAARLTLFNTDRKALAERLFYLGKADALNVEIKADKESYAPRDLVTLEIAVTDAKGNPVEGDFALSVVDDTVLNYADDKTGEILASLLLLPEMPGQLIDEPNFYFSDDEKAPRALDLLLGTQGWRRFEFEW